SAGPSNSGPVSVRPDFCPDGRAAVNHCRTACAHLISVAHIPHLLTLRSGGSKLMERPARTEIAACPGPLPEEAERLSPPTSPTTSSRWGRGNTDRLPPSVAPPALPPVAVGVPALDLLPPRRGLHLTLPQLGNDREIVQTNPPHGCLPFICPGCW